MECLWLQPSLILGLNPPPRLPPWLTTHHPTQGWLSLSLTTSTMLQALGVGDVGPLGTTALTAAYKWIAKVGLHGRSVCPNFFTSYVFYKQGLRGFKTWLSRVNYIVSELIIYNYQQIYYIYMYSLSVPHGQGWHRSSGASPCGREVGHGAR